tara:strand:+ start:97 stop:288 length:192 start_codon:yes stop_codon:yes gene_type:complete
MEKSNSATNFQKKQVLEKLEILEENIKLINIRLDMLLQQLNKVDKKIPIRSAGWFGDYKSYGD